MSAAMDLALAIFFVDCLVGIRRAGIDANGDDVGPPMSPEARTFIFARIGAAMPSSGWDASRKPEKAAAIAGFLREVADALHPSPAAAAAPDLLDALDDSMSGWRYIRSVHGDLSGVGWDRVENAARAARAKANGDNA